MSGNDVAIQEQWDVLDNYNLEKALHFLRHCEMDVQEFLADSVAVLCDVDKSLMLSDCNTIHVAQARWLYWYAYRYMTSETYEKIVANTERLCGKRFTKQGVASSVNKMSLLIESQPIWKKRWTISRRIIKLRDGNEEEGEKNSTIVIHVPKGLKDRLNIQIKEI